MQVKMIIAPTISRIFIGNSDFYKNSTYCPEWQSDSGQAVMVAIKIYSCDISLSALGEWSSMTSVAGS